MPRQARVVAAQPHSPWRQRGNNRQQTFFSDAQRRRYLALLGQYTRLNELRILGYCLMPNHVHLIAVPDREDALAKGVGRADNAYSRYLKESSREFRDGARIESRVSRITALNMNDFSPQRRRFSSA